MTKCWKISIFILFHENALKFFPAFSTQWFAIINHKWVSVTCKVFLALIIVAQICPLHALFLQSFINPSTAISTHLPSLLHVTSCYSMSLAVKCYLGNISHHFPCNDTYTSVAIFLRISTITDPTVITTMLPTFTNSTSPLLPPPLPSPFST